MTEEQQDARRHRVSLQLSLKDISLDMLALRNMLLKCGHTPNDPFQRGKHRTDGTAAQTSTQQQVFLAALWQLWKKRKKGQEQEVVNGKLCKTC